MIDDGADVPERFRRLVEHAVSLLDAFGAPPPGFELSRFLLLVREGDPAQVEPREREAFINERVRFGETARAEELSAPCDGVWCVAIADGEAVSIPIRFHHAAPGGDA